MNLESKFHFGGKKVIPTQLSLNYIHFPEEGDFTKTKHKNMIGRCAFHIYQFTINLSDGSYRKRKTTTIYSNMDQNSIRLQPVIDVLYTAPPTTFNIIWTSDSRLGAFSNGEWYDLDAPEFAEIEQQRMEGKRFVLYSSPLDKNNALYTDAVDEINDLSQESATDIKRISKLIEYLCIRLPDIDPFFRAESPEHTSL